jgi:hypothetical protein
LHGNSSFFVAAEIHIPAQDIHSLCYSPTFYLHWFVVNTASLKCKMLPIIFLTCKFTWLIHWIEREPREPRQNFRFIFPFSNGCLCALRLCVIYTNKFWKFKPFAGYHQQPFMLNSVLLVFENFRFIFPFWSHGMFSYVLSRAFILYCNSC